jgi:hypothetical protein
MTRYEHTKIEALLTSLYENGNISKEAFNEVMRSMPLKSKPA